MGCMEQPTFSPVAQTQSWRVALIWFRSEALRKRRVYNKASLVLDVSLLHSLVSVEAASRSSNLIPKLPRMPLKA
jgi:hypothetical protein